MITITIKNFKKHNARQNRKNYNWFKFDSNFFFDQKTCELTHEEKLLFIFLLCIRNKSDIDEISYSENQVMYLLGFEEEEQKKYLNNIASLGLIELNSSTNVTQSCTKLSQSGRLDKIRLDKIRLDKGVTESSENNDKKEVKESGITARVKPVAVTLEAWACYVEQFKLKYKTPPVRNAILNSQMSNFCKRIPKEQWENIIRFYFSHQNSFYISNAHSVGILLKDCEKLHTEMMSGRYVFTAKNNKSYLNAAVVTNLINEKAMTTAPEESIEDKASKLYELVNKG